MVQKIFRDQHDDEWEINIIEAIGVRGVMNRDFHSDVVIARGVASVALRNILVNIPVVNLPVSGYDVIRAVLECQKKFTYGKIAIVGAYDMIFGAQIMQELMKIEVITVPVNNEEEAEKCIKKLKADGIRVVVGGVMSTQIASFLDMDTIFIHSGPEAIHQAIEEAKRVGRVRRQEQERSEQFRTILNYTSEGILAVDSFGYINLANSVAERLINLPEKFVSQKADEILPELSLGKVLSTGNAKLGELKTINGQQVSINSVPIVIKEQVAGAVATFQPVSAIQELEEQIRQKIHQRGLVAKLTFNDILGHSLTIQSSIAMAREFSKVDSNVLIVGATGSGKEIFAQSIHNSSRRSRGPFVAVNCAALPEDLLESELFGYVEGAFTGALRTGKTGLFEQAHRGTLFLDEIADISPNLQVRLLRVLQEREIRRLGDSKVITIDVRVIAATNKDLLKMMDDGSFRADLYYRLDVLNVTVPSLRERPEDILPLMKHFLKLYCTKVNKPCKKFAADAEMIIIAYPWPGNVRELRNVAERLAVVTSSDIISTSNLMMICPQISRNQYKAVNEPMPEMKSEASADNDCSRIVQTLEKTHYHYGRAAAELGISRTTLWRRMKEFEINCSK